MLQSQEVAQDHPLELVGEISVDKLPYLEVSKGAASAYPNFFLDAGEFLAHLRMAMEPGKRGEGGAMGRMDLSFLKDWRKP